MSDQFLEISRFAIAEYYLRCLDKLAKQIPTTVGWMMVHDTLENFNDDLSMKRSEMKNCVKEEKATALTRENLDNTLVCLERAEAAIE